MKSGDTIQFRTDSVNIINLVIKHWKILLLTGILSVIISAAISLTIKPAFRSAVVLYPTTNVMESQSLLGVQTSATPLFGDETATEKVLQILKSDNIKNFLVSKYELMSHYGISNSSKYKYTMLAARMNRNIVSRKTQYGSVEISVLDSDPVNAAAMANDIASQVDTVFNQIVKESGRKSYHALSRSYTEQYSRVCSLEDSVKMTAAKGSPLAGTVNFKAGSSGSAWAVSPGQYSPGYLRLMNMFETENENLSAIRSRLTEAKIISQQDLPYTHIINAAQVSEKKAEPRRTLIVLVSTLSALLFMFFILAVAEMVVRDEKQA